jgi:hypothetical protein
MPSTVERRETDGATPRSVYAPPPRPPRRQRSKAVATGGSMPGMDMSGGTTGSSELTSYAGQTPTNADAMAKSHVPMNATLPPVSAGPVAHVRLVLVDKTLQIAPGVKYRAWAFSGGAPAPSSTCGRDRRSS